MPLGDEAFDADAAEDDFMGSIRDAGLYRARRGGGVHVCAGRLQLVRETHEAVRQYNNWHPEGERSASRCSSIAWTRGRARRRPRGRGLARGCRATNLQQKHKILVVSCYSKMNQLETDAPRLKSKLREIAPAVELQLIIPERRSIVLWGDIQEQGKLTCACAGGVDALQTETEDYLINMFHDVNLIAIQSKRETVFVDDVELWKIINSIKQ